MSENIDVLIIGGGIIGCTVARELSKWKLNTVLVEKDYDVAFHASGRNSGMVHPGLDLARDTLKFKYCVPGNAMFDGIAKDLGVPFKRSGQYVVLHKHWHKLVFPFLKLRALRNKIPNVKLLGRRAVTKREPHIKGHKGAIFMGSAGIVNPFIMTVAYAENAVQNGVRVMLNTEVTGMKVEGGRIVEVATNKGNFAPLLVINCAGVYADTVAGMAGDAFFKITPRVGIHAVLDKKYGHLTNSTIGQPPDKRYKSKGGGIGRTGSGNILVGPDAIEVEEKEDYASARSNIEAVFSRHKTIPVDESMVINYFMGTRAAIVEPPEGAAAGGDFVIENGRKTANIIHVAGIQSPGLTAAPAIALDVEKTALQAVEKFSGRKVEANKNFNPVRKGIVNPTKLSDAERGSFISSNPDYGVIVCRCEEVSKGEIIAAINSPVPATTLDAIKRRVRAGMGRCQGGFCCPLVAKIISDETGIPLTQIEKGKPGSGLFSGETKQ